jgi:hypothetical protein
MRDATVLMNGKAGRNAFDIRGDGASPFEVGDRIKIICFERGACEINRETLE